MDQGALVVALLLETASQGVRLEHESVMSSHSGVPQSCSRPWRLLLFHVKRSLNLWFVVVAVRLLVSLGQRRSALRLAVYVSGHGAQLGVVVEAAPTGSACATLAACSRGDPRA